MRPSPTALAVILTALLLAPGVLRAGGSSETRQPAGPTPGQPVTAVSARAYWLLEEGAANAQMLLERFYLPTSLSVLRWTEFSVVGGDIELASTGGYRVIRKDRILTESWKGRVLHGYEVRIEFTGQADAPSRSSRRYGVSFAYDSSGADRGEAGAGGSGEADAVPQPLQQALLKGIEASGRGSGTARVLELTYEGRGRFRAKVEVQ